MSPFVFLFLHLLIHVNLCFSSLNTHLFNTWCHQQHGKSYSSEEEKLFRLSVFEDNLAFVTQHNSMKNTTYSLALNDFADLTYQEFKTSHFGPNFTASLDDPVQSVRKSPLSPRGSTLVEKVATSIDWRKKGVVTPVQNEASTCSDYTHHAGNIFCSKYKDDYAIVPANNEGQLLQAVAAQPVHAGICANERTFQFYSKGVFTGPCSTTLDHAVLIVGYDSENEVDYWIVKNSWGTNWGMNGYMHILRNSGHPEGMCGINTLASYTIKNNLNPNPLLQPSSSVRVSCDLLRYCRDGETCCCSKRFIICLTWICCKNAGAVCCDDHERCCPHGYACDAGICYKDHDNFTATRMLEQSSSWTFQG